MDAATLSKLILQRCPKLAHLFAGCFASDNFPILHRVNQFLIANTATSNNDGEHWILIARTITGVMYFDSLDPIRIPDNFMDRLTAQYTSKLFSSPDGPWITQLRPTDLGLQSQSFYTTTCALYCIYAAHIIFSNRRAMFSLGIRLKQQNQQQRRQLDPARLYITEDDILRFCNEHYNVRLHKNVLLL